MEAESWRWNRGGGIMEDALWRMHHEEHQPGIASRHPGGTQVAPRGTKEASRGTQEAPGSTKIAADTWETPTRRPGDSRQAPRRHPGHPRLKRPPSAGNSNHSQLKCKS